MKHFRIADYARLAAYSRAAGALTLAVGAVASLAQSPPKDQSRIIVDGSTTVGPIAKAFAEHFMKRNPTVSITVGESGSGNGVKSLINKTCDVAALSRFMTPAEYKAAIEADETPVAHAIAIDGIAIVVHPSNPVQNLSLPQVRDIYAGKINNWKEVGGPDVRIVRISRDTNSGTFKSFEELVMGGARVAADTEKVGSNGGERQRVASTPAAVGYVGLGFLGRDLKALNIDGVAATPENIIAGRYAIARPLFLFTNGYPALGSHLYSFCTMHLSPEGQAIIEELGFIPLTRYADPNSVKDE